MFKITVNHLHWINNSPDDPHDLCAHGHVIAVIGDEIFEYDATVSSTALYLLKTITENHFIGEENQMLPCCGYFIIPNDNMNNVEIMGCQNGVDWSVIHENDDTIKIISQNRNEIRIPIEEYKAEVFAFADEVEDFYNNCSNKILPIDDYEKKGYIAFWNEWRRRNHRL